jgi:hypothetical protein
VSNLPQAGEIRSNLKPVTTSYDEELFVPEAQETFYNSLPDGDRKMSTQEEDELAEKYAENYQAAAARRWEGQERWIGRENEEMRMVNILHPHAIFRKLQRAGVDARIESPTFWVWGIDDKTGKPVQQQKQRSCGRLWLHDHVVQDRVAISGRVWDPQLRRSVIKKITWLQWPYCPEWSLMHFDAFDVPLGERFRGWRTAMLNLILAGALTEREVDRAFGQVLLNDASLLYRKTLYMDRLKRGGHIL